MSTGLSCAEPCLTQTPTEAERTPGTCSESTRTPFSSSVSATRLSDGTAASAGEATSCLAGGGAGRCGPVPFLLEDRFAREPESALLIDGEELHADDVALLHDVLRLLDPSLGQLGDVTETFRAGHDLDEGAEGGRVLHRTFVDAAHPGLLHEGRDHLPRAGT